MRISSINPSQSLFRSKGVCYLFSTSVQKSRSASLNSRINKTRFHFCSFSMLLFLFVSFFRVQVVIDSLWRKQRFSVIRLDKFINPSMNFLFSSQCMIIFGTFYDFPMFYIYLDNVKLKCCANVVMFKMHVDFPRYKLIV